MLFDTETTGLPVNYNKSALVEPNNWPHIVSISWIIYDLFENKTCSSKNYIVYPSFWNIPEESSAIHGITYEKAILEGADLRQVINDFLSQKYDILIAHNMNFDYNVLLNAIQWDLHMTDWLERIPKARLCTMEISRNICKLPSKNGYGYKYPKLSELYQYACKCEPDKSSLHSSMYDTLLLKEIIEKSDEIRMAMGLPASRVVETHKNGANKNEPRTLHITLA